MSQLTKRQHVVPAFYLKLWTQKNHDTVVCHDLMNQKSFGVLPSNVMVRRHYYEEDIQTPDNRVENILAGMEGESSAYFAALKDLAIEPVNSLNEKEYLDKVKSILSVDACMSIKKFAAYQYLRVPGAISQKKHELAESNLNDIQKDYFLNAGRFVNSGFSYIEKRFQSLKLLVLMSTGQDFITSDWPCFDIKDSEWAPLLAEEIGSSNDVVAYLPLTPRIGVVLYPAGQSIQDNIDVLPNAHVVPCEDSVVRNQNTLIIQQADRFVIANESKDFIFKIAKKRKKNANV